MCPSDNTGLTADVAKTAVASCSSPAGSDPKCEMTCKTGYVVNGNNCIASPPVISGGVLNVSNVLTGGTPTASWQSSNAVRCSLSSDTGYGPIDACTSEAACGSVSFPISKTVMEETTYTLNCYNIEGATVTVQATPLAYTVLTATPSNVTVIFSGGGATAEPPVELRMVSWNGFRDSVSFTPNFATASPLPESPGDDTTNHITVNPTTLSFVSTIAPKTSLAEIFASYRFTGSKTVKISGTGSNEVSITVLGESSTPGYEDY